jgi:hypothetical protein
VTVTHVDAAALVADHLRTVLPGLDVPGPVVTAVPKPRPTAFTTVRRIGGVTRNEVTDGPMLDIHVWAGNEHTAMERMQIVRSVIHDLIGSTLDGNPVYRINEVQGPSMFPDTDSNQPRATYVVEVWIRGVT